MRNEFVRFVAIPVIVFALFLSPFMSVSFAQNATNLPNLYRQANEHFMLGEYHQAIEIYDEILEESPNSKKTLLMKGIALSNLERHKSSILEFAISLGSLPPYISQRIVIIPFEIKASESE